MRRLVVDTEVVSYIFKWHTSAPRYVELLADNEVILSFVMPAEIAQCSPFTLALRPFRIVGEPWQAV